MPNEIVGICVECFNDLYQTDALPDHPNLYECHKCGHPNGPITKGGNK